MVQHRDVHRELNACLIMGLEDVFKLFREVVELKKFSHSCDMVCFGKRVDKKV